MAKAYNHKLVCSKCGHLGCFHYWAGKGHCSIKECKCDGGKYSKKTKQTNLVEDYKFPDTKNRFKLGEK